MIRRYASLLLRTSSPSFVSVQPIFVCDMDGHRRIGRIACFASATVAPVSLPRLRPKRAMSYLS